MSAEGRPGPLAIVGAMTDEQAERIRVTAAGRLLHLLSRNGGSRALCGTRVLWHADDRPDLEVFDWELCSRCQRSMLREL